ncbi:oxidoreductase [Streptomyces sp. MH60]|uniref:oxidoreductase n=1 Tax=Streptomyces sp. MH60 TaxID=1940758 RepID=UPI000CEF211D|nr:oxidoreductase [Streptomyces sp. MH60]
MITEGTDGIGRGIARVHLARGERVVDIGTDKAKTEPGAWFLRADLDLIDENGRLIDRLSPELDTIDVLVLGARVQRSRHTETADGLESYFELTYLSRFLLSRGLAGLLGRAAGPGGLNYCGAGCFGPPRWDGLQQRTQHHGRTAAIQAGILNAPLAVDFVGHHPAIRYVNYFPGTVATSFAGDCDDAEAAQIDRLRVTGNPVETAVKEILPFLDSGSPGHPVAVSARGAVLLDSHSSPPADARRLYDYTREVLAR